MKVPLLSEGACTGEARVVDPGNCKAGVGEAGTVDPGKGEAGTREARAVDPDNDEASAGEVGLGGRGVLR